MGDAKRMKFDVLETGAPCSTKSNMQWAIPYFSSYKNQPKPLNLLVLVKRLLEKASANLVDEIVGFPPPATHSPIVPLK
ncbi:hypothetical protein RvY_08134 [Ramazzottius varieornatus]|uniref:Uncharacterized protein n=1 Tax=Ramazzottius varieornatus TaxID=947166 RepID=A0A1D1VCY9_RAMVA|nr:hypothetical protein RvY_08134 [Ramazzottius varieornatus]